MNYKAAEKKWSKRWQRMLLRTEFLLKKQYLITKEQSSEIFYENSKTDSFQK